MFRFSIRSLLLLTLLVAIGLTTWLHYERSKPPSLKKQVSEAEKVNAALRKEIEELNAKIAKEQIRRRAIIGPLRSSKGATSAI